MPFALGLGIKGEEISNEQITQSITFLLRAFVGSETDPVHQARSGVAQGHHSPSAELGSEPILLPEEPDVCTHTLSNLTRWLATNLLSLFQ